MKKAKHIDGYYSNIEVARLFGVSRVRPFQMMKEGKLPEPMMVDNFAYYPKEIVDEMAAERVKKLQEKLAKLTGK